MDFIADYGLFLAKSITYLLFLISVVSIVVSSSVKMKKEKRGHLEVECLNKHYEKMKNSLECAFLNHVEEKKYLKQKKKEQKLKEKKLHNSKTNKPRLFVLNFNGDIKASAVESLREEITAILSVANKHDEVLLCLESVGGQVHSYGLAASQLQRIRDKDIKLTVSVDKVAASGGYLMAAVANAIICAPFSIIGSIGVVAQLPNFNKLLKKLDVDIELHTAGQYKRTLTILGKNTQQGREKFKQDIEDTHVLFKKSVSQVRDKVDIEKVSTGEIWYGQQALDLKLVDNIQTSDEFIYKKMQKANIVKVAFVVKKNISEKIGLSLYSVVENFCTKTFSKLFNQKQI